MFFHSQDSRTSGDAYDKKCWTCDRKTEKSLLIKVMCLQCAITEGWKGNKKNNMNKV